MNKVSHTQQPTITLAIRDTVARAIVSHQMGETEAQRLEHLRRRIVAAARPHILKNELRYA